MEIEKREGHYLVILNKEDVLGEFKHEEDATLFAYICALHGDNGDIIDIYESKAGFEIAK